MTGNRDLAPDGHPKTSSLMEALRRAALDARRRYGVRFVGRVYGEGVRWEGENPHWDVWTVHVNGICTFDHEREGRCESFMFDSARMYEDAMVVVHCRPEDDSTIPQ